MSSIEFKNSQINIHSDEELETSFRVWWNERYRSAYYGAVPLIAVIEWTRYFNNLLNRQTSVNLDVEQVIGILHVSNFRGYENAQFDYIAELPDGRYELFIQPAHPAESKTNERRMALNSIAALNQECDDYGDDYGQTTRDDIEDGENPVKYSDSCPSC